MPGKKSRARAYAWAGGVGWDCRADSRLDLGSVVLSTSCIQWWDCQQPSEWSTHAVKHFQRSKQNAAIKDTHVDLWGFYYSFKTLKQHVAFDYQTLTFFGMPVLWHCKLPAGCMALDKLPNRNLNSLEPTDGATEVEKSKML